MKTVQIMLEIDSTVSCIERFNPGKQWLKVFLSYHKLAGFQALLYIDAGFLTDHLFLLDRMS